MTYFRGRDGPLSSALSRFTVLFGMGRGGSNSLWSSGSNWNEAKKYSVRLTTRAQAFLGPRATRVSGLQAFTHTTGSAHRGHIPLCAPHPQHAAHIHAHLTPRGAKQRFSTFSSTSLAACRLQPHTRLSSACLAVPASTACVQSYRVKPHGQLVLVSSTCCHACTPSLSTSWSRTTLQEGQAFREISSSGKFPA